MGYLIVSSNMAKNPPLVLHDFMGVGNGNLASASPPPPPPPQGFTKKLSKSDVGRRDNQFLLFKDKVQEFIIPNIASDEQRRNLAGGIPVSFNTVDATTGKAYGTALKLYGANYFLINTLQIVLDNQLKQGQEIRFCWENGGLKFSLL